MTVASFNTLYGLSPRTLGHRPYDLIDTCRRLDADVLALQEVWRPDGWPSGAAAVADALGYEVHEVALARADRAANVPHIRGRAGTTGGTGDWLVAVLSRLPVRSTSTVPLPHLPFDPVDRAVVSVDVWVGGRAFSVLTTHLPHLEHGSLLLRRALRRTLPDAQRPAAFVGDLNMWSPLATWMAPGWRRAAKGWSWPSRRPFNQLDHILVTPPVGVLSGEVVKVVRSDHRPVRARLRF